MFVWAFILLRCYTKLTVLWMFFAYMGEMICGIKKNTTSCVIYTIHMHTFVGMSLSIMVNVGQSLDHVD